MFITKQGLFLTARHVVGKWSTDSHVVWALNFRMNGKKDCRVLELERHPDFDIAIGIAEEPGRDGWPDPFTLSSGRIGNRSAVWTYGFANTLATPHRDPNGPINLEDKLTIELDPKVYRGHVVEYLDRGPGLNCPCYHVSFDPGGGISGGPLVRKRTGAVHGIMNAGIPASEVGGAASGFASDLKILLDSWQIGFLGHTSLREYARKNPKELVIR